MVGKITLPWADKFREIVKSERFHEDVEETYDAVVRRFTDYIDEQEKKINERYKK